MILKFSITKITSVISESSGKNKNDEVKFHKVQIRFFRKLRDLVSSAIVG